MLTAAFATAPIPASADETASPTPLDRCERRLADLRALGRVANDQAAARARLIADQCRLEAEIYYRMLFEQPINDLKTDLAAASRQYNRIMREVARLQREGFETTAAPGQTGSPGMLKS